MHLKPMREVEHFLFDEQREERFPQIGKLAKCLQPIARWIATGSDTSRLQQDWCVLSTGEQESVIGALAPQLVTGILQALDDWRSLPNSELGDVLFRTEMPNGSMHRAAVRWLVMFISVVAKFGPKSVTVDQLVDFECDSAERGIIGIFVERNVAIAIKTLSGVFLPV